MPTEKQLANLRPFSKQTESEAREFGKKAGIKSGESRRFLKAFKEAFEKMNDKEGIVQELCIAAFKEAKKGNVRAMEFVRDTMGQKPADKIETTGQVQVKKVFVTPEMQTEADKIIDDKLKKYKNS